MTEDEASTFVAGWIDAWNRRDLAMVLAHYAPDIRFYSPIAAKVAGRSFLDGKPALEAYWRQAMEEFPALAFTLDCFTWDAAQKLLSIHYVASLNGQRRMVCESQWFDEDGRVIRAVAYYGVTL